MRPQTFRKLQHINEDWVRDVLTFRQAILGNKRRAADALEHEHDMLQAAEYAAAGVAEPEQRVRARKRARTCEIRVEPDEANDEYGGQITLVRGDDTLLFVPNPRRPGPTRELHVPTMVLHEPAMPDGVRMVGLDIARRRSWAMPPKAVGHVVDNRDLLSAVFAHLSPNKLLKMRLVSRRWCEVATADARWTRWAWAIQWPDGIPTWAPRVTFRKYVQLSLRGLVDRRRQLVAWLVKPRPNMDHVRAFFNVGVNHASATQVLTRTAKDCDDGWYYAVEIPGEAHTRKARVLIHTHYTTYFIPPRKAQIIDAATGKDVLPRFVTRWKQYVKDAVWRAGDANP